MKTSYLTILAWVLLGAFALFMLGHNVNQARKFFSGEDMGVPSEFAEQAWQDGPHPDIEKTLAANHATGCERFKNRENPVIRQEYLVHCTSDGTTWQAWLVWPRTGKTYGPRDPDPRMLN